MRYNRGSLTERGPCMEDLMNHTDAGFERKKIAGIELTDFCRYIKDKHTQEDTMFTFLCIGTDRSTGDALGPLVGTRLEEYGVKYVIGTLKHPCDADNLEKRMAAVPAGHVIIAIDACLGSSASVGSYLVSGQPLVPAESVGGNLPAVGHYSIAAVVNAKGPKPYWILQMTSLYKVMQMADEIARSVAQVFADQSEPVRNGNTHSGT